MFRKPRRRITLTLEWRDDQHPVVTLTRWTYGTTNKALRNAIAWAFAQQPVDPPSIVTATYDGYVTRV